MKIAFVTDDGKFIHSHFGRASHYLVVEIQNGEISERLLLPKFLHHTEAHKQHDDDMSKEDKHTRMFKTISDCDLLIANGMGYGARAAAEAVGIKVVNTAEKNIEFALQLFLSGQLENDSHLVH
jgi:predicted Fe-Mo cluster-binding NifX family protein